MGVLVTGAGGMVGSHMVELLHQEGKDVIGTYYKPTTDLRELPSDIRMIECDVRYAPTVEKIIMEYQPEQIYHLAAQSYPTVSWDRPYETIETNINGTIAVYEAVKAVRSRSCTRWTKPHARPAQSQGAPPGDFGLKPAPSPGLHSEGRLKIVQRVCAAF